MGLMDLLKDVFSNNPDDLSDEEYRRRLDGLASDLFGSDFESCTREQRLTVQSHLRLGKRPQVYDDDDY